MRKPDIVKKMAVEADIDALQAIDTLNLILNTVVSEIESTGTGSIPGFGTFKLDIIPMYNRSFAKSVRLKFKAYDALKKKI